MSAFRTKEKQADSKNKNKTKPKAAFSVGQKEEEKRVFHLEAVVLLYLPLELELCPKRESLNLPVARKNRKNKRIEANHSDLKIGYLPWKRYQRKG